MQITKNAEIFFAFTFPFSFEDCEKMLNANKILAKTYKNIYYHDEVCIRSPQGRSLHLLTISSHDEKLSVREDPINDILCIEGIRPFRFSSAKKVVLITGRVHPSEAPASHTMNGVINFLLSKYLCLDVGMRGQKFCAKTLCLRLCPCLTLTVCTMAIIGWTSSIRTSIDTTYIRVQ